MKSTEVESRRITDCGSTWCRLKEEIEREEETERKRERERERKDTEAGYNGVFEWSSSVLHSANTIQESTIE